MFYTEISQPVTRSTKRQTSSVLIRPDATEIYRETVTEFNQGDSVITADNETIIVGNQDLESLAVQWSELPQYHLFFPTEESFRTALATLSTVIQAACDAADLQRMSI